MPDDDPDAWSPPDHPEIQIPNWLLRMLLSDMEARDSGKKHLAEWEKRQPREGVT